MSGARGKILVTGANGFVGQHALRALRKRFPGARLVGSVQLAGAACPGADDVVALDLRDAGGVEAIVVSVVPDAVLHLAAQAAVPASFADPGGTWSVNLTGTLMLAEALLRHSPQAIFIHASSAEIYGISFRSGHALTEDAPFAPARAVSDHSGSYPAALK